MTTATSGRQRSVAGFRAKLVIAMMLVVGTLTALVLVVVERQQAGALARELRTEFGGELAALHHAQSLRLAALSERCRALARRPRLHAALEDDALDLLYPSARDELQDVMADANASQEATPGYALHARFYRFLDARGAVLPPARTDTAGALSAEEEAQLALPSAPARQQLGYLIGEEGIAEIIAMPIISTATGEVIAALVLGFDPAEWLAPNRRVDLRRGVWLRGKLWMAGVGEGTARELSAALATVTGGGEQGEQQVTLGGAAYLLFYDRLNAGSAYPPAYEVSLYALAPFLERRQELRWRVVGLGAAVLLVGLGLSHGLARRLARPVEKLASDSEQNLALRRRAEAALETTNEELQRAARFSADASHQLKTPVTVLRLGLEELLKREDLSVEECQELAALIHQTYRLSGLIEDLLLLSRMDAGRLSIEFRPVNLAELIAASLDDLEAMPDERELAVETEVPAELWVTGEKRYLALVLHNLLENARKYNRPGGRIQVRALAQEGEVRLTIGNSGAGISPTARGRIFERFHRANAAENIPGYGLGLNLARELARLHGGDVELLASTEDWTEFRVRFRAAARPAEVATNV